MTRILGVFPLGIRADRYTWEYWGEITPPKKLELQAYLERGQNEEKMVQKCSEKPQFAWKFFSGKCACMLSSVCVFACFCFDSHVLR